MDNLAKGLTNDQLLEYQAAKYRFEQRLGSWKQTIALDLARFNDNAAEGYYELEAQLLNAKQKQS